MSFSSDGPHPFDPPPDASFDTSFASTITTSHYSVAGSHSTAPSVDGTESDTDTQPPLSRPDSPWASPPGSETDEDDYEVLRRHVLATVYADGGLEIEAARIRKCSGSL